MSDQQRPMTDAERAALDEYTKQELTAQQPATAPRVWLVRELVDEPPPSRKSNEWDNYILAVSAAQACEIVGEDERRRIVVVQEVCQITRGPGDVFRVETMNQPTP